MGWIKKIRRPYHSNVYYVDEDIVKLNLEDISIFCRPVQQCVTQSVTQSVTQNVHVLDAASSDPLIPGINPDQEEPQVQASNTEQIKPYDDHPIMNVEGLSFDDKAKLSMMYDEWTLAKAVKQVRWYQSDPRKTIRNMWNFITKTADNCIKRGY